MGLRTKFAIAGTTGLFAMAAGLLAAPEPKPAAAPETRLLIAHSLGVAIDGTTSHLTARSIATLPDRKEGEAKGAIEAMRASARSAYKDSNSLFDEARMRMANHPGDATARQLYDAAVAYTKTMWELTGEATPTTREKSETSPTGTLSIDDLATLETINQTVRATIGAFLLGQLTLRAHDPGNAAIAALDDHAKSVATASKKAATSFPGIPEALLAGAGARLEEAKQEKEAAKREKSAAKDIEKIAKHLQSRAGTEQAKEIQEEAKQTKKQAGKTQKEAEKAKQKAEKAAAKEVGADARASVRTLGHQGRALILLLDQMIDKPEMPPKGETAKAP
jgi:hypothetical protein